MCTVVDTSGDGALLGLTWAPTRSLSELFHRGPLSDAGEGIWFAEDLAPADVVAALKFVRVEGGPAGGAILDDAGKPPSDEAM